MVVVIDDTGDDGGANNKFGGLWCGRDGGLLVVRWWQ